MDWNTLPDNLPVPVDDGAADHLTAQCDPAEIAHINLPATSGSPVNIYTESLERPVLLFIYPRTGQPGVPNPNGWDDIPGARGCTPELCSIKDSIESLLQLTPRPAIFALSTQGTAYQLEVATRLSLPYPILSDEGLELTRALRLPTFEVQGETLLKRITLLFDKGRVVGLQYPVFPSNQAAQDAQKLFNL
ncbi:peroxiredoxin [Suillus paluster]|uniref:peroxiredoxin n=1 Tax=Suillus paluster TaxID=48578 RepID=UPI001B8611F2|nr:peroxiredoxin [Suillus paluster]KAG1739114.1 peroxiredoxin [Suillus paluster]